MVEKKSKSDTKELNPKEFNFTMKSVLDDLKHFLNEEELGQTKNLNTPNELIGLTPQQIEKLFIAKCEDQKLVPKPLRADRFVELVSKSCVGLRFGMKDQGYEDNGAKVIRSILSNNRSYSILDLSANRLKDSGTIEIAKIFETNDTIVHLDLRSNDIGHKGAEVLCEVLQHNRALVSLDFSGLSGINRNHISTKGATAIAQLISKNHIISNLNLGSNGLGEEGIKALCHGLRHNPTIVHLDISSNNMGSAACVTLGSAISTMPSLRILNLERNNILDKGITAISNHLASSKTLSLEELHLAENKLTITGIKALCMALRQPDSSIKYLDLDNNEIGDFGGEEVGLMLENNNSLETLILTKCGIQAKGANIIAKALKDFNKKLSKLDFSNNFIDDDIKVSTEKSLENIGSKSFAETLTNNISLQYLNLANNRISDNGGIQLMKSVEQNKTLLFLIVKQNDMNGAGESLAESLKTNTTILHIDFAYNNFSYKAYSQITEFLKRNAAHYKMNESQRILSELNRYSNAEAQLQDVKNRIEKEIQLQNQSMILYDQIVLEGQNLDKALEKEVLDLQEKITQTEASRREKEKLANSLTEEFEGLQGNNTTHIRKLEGRIDTEKTKLDTLTKTLKKITKEVTDARKALEEKNQPIAQGLHTERDKFKELEKSHKSLETNLQKVLLQIEALENYKLNPPLTEPENTELNPTNTEISSAHAPVEQNSTENNGSAVATETVAATESSSNV